MLFFPAHTIDPLSKERHKNSLETLIDVMVLPAGIESGIGEFWEVEFPSPNCP